LKKLEIRPLAFIKEERSNPEYSISSTKLYGLLYKFGYILKNQSSVPTSYYETENVTVEMAGVLYFFDDIMEATPVQTGEAILIEIINSY